MDARRFARYCLLRCWNSQLEALAKAHVQPLWCSLCPSEGNKGEGRARPVPHG